MRLGPPEPGDADALAEILLEGLATYSAFAPEGWALEEDRLEIALGIAMRFSDPERWFCVGRDAAGAVVGFSGGEPSLKSRPEGGSPEVAHLGHCFVRPAAFGTGLASSLLAAAVDEAAARGFAVMRLFTPAMHARARRFYEREGWHVAGEPHFAEPLGLEVVEYRRGLREGRDVR